MELRLGGPFVQRTELRLGDDADTIQARETALEFHGRTDSRERLDRDLDPLGALLREELAERILAHGLLGGREGGTAVLALPHPPESRAGGDDGMVEPRQIVHAG